MRTLSRAELCPRSSYLHFWSRIFVLSVMLCLLPAAVRGAIDVSETGLHDLDDVYGIEAPTTPVPFVNAQDITVLAWGETNPALYADVSFRAFGIFAEVDTTNEGDIAITGTGGTADAYTADAYVEAYGVYTDYGLITNSGAIDVTALGGTVASATIDFTADTESAAWSHGLYAWDGAIDNSGSVAVTATGGSTTSSAINTQHEINAWAWAYGLRLYGAPTYTYSGRHANNSGAITATATGGTAAGSVDEANASAWAYGIDADEAPVTNSGLITAFATGGSAQSNSIAGDPGAYASARAYGINVDHGDVDNDAAIVARATGGTASGTGAAEASATAEATGIYAQGGPAGETVSVQNSGAFTVMATGGTAESVSATADADAAAYGLRAAYADVVNSGALTVTATAENGANSTAYGIYLDDVTTLTNTGVIRATGATAYELAIASGTATLVDTYNVTLDGDPTQASIYVADGATLALNDATLTATAVSGEIQWNAEYQLFETAGTGTVAGSFADVQAANPKTTVAYDTQGTGSAADDTVALSYTPSASEVTGSAAVAQQLVSRSIDTVNQHMTTTVLQGVLSPGTSGLLADAGPTARSMVLAQSASGERRSGLFVEPYYSTMEHDANPLGYDARLWGFAAGYERQMDNTLIGLHAGYGQADVDYTGAGYSANSEDQDILTAGVSGLTRWSDWTLRYGLTGFYGSHDYRGLTGLSLTETETASMDSYGVMASVMAGHIFQRDAHVFLPEVGVNYIWGHRQRYTTDASDPAWDTTYSATNDHDLQAEAALHWLCGFMYQDIYVLPSASIGVRHLLTDGESTVSQSVPGTAPVLVTSERDRTAMTLSGSVALTRARHTVSASYDGEYAPDTQRHSFWLRYGWQF